ncbi:hypothetical protein CPC08DRAFT_757491 [Agrocybe pediades]|nr:hypothetical protein CPC08DRAFT_757491 [Agrocybe pediades]
MLSLYSKAATLPGTANAQQKNEIGDLRDAIVSFTSLTVDSGRASVRLFCTVPTWSASTDTCLDLHDLNELRSRFLVFVHDLLQSLRASGVSASYSLSPSSSPLCVIGHRPLDTATVLDKLHQSKGTLKKEQVALVDVDNVTCLIMT